MRISIVGCGCIGCVTGICFSDMGNEIPPADVRLYDPFIPSVETRTGVFTRLRIVTVHFRVRTVQSSLLTMTYFAIYCPDCLQRLWTRLG